jgi:hypothetical protein
MKFGLLVLLVLIGVLLWRNRQPPQDAAEKKVDTPNHEPLDMVRCTLCSVHIPVADAVLRGPSPTRGTVNEAASQCCTLLVRAQPA